MRQRNWTSCAGVVVCLAFCVAATLLWVRSYWTRDWVQLIWTTGSMVDLNAESDSGELRVSVIDDHGEEVAYQVPQVFTWQREPATGQWARALWHFTVYRKFSAPARYVTAEFPYWAICAVSAAPMYLVVKKWTARHARARARRCLSCGYDLRASPGRCPECGTPVRHARAAEQP